MALSSDTIIKQNNNVFKPLDSPISKTKFITPLAAGPILDFPTSAGVSGTPGHKSSRFFTLVFPSLSLTHIQSITNFCWSFAGGYYFSYLSLFFHLHCFTLLKPSLPHLRVTMMTSLLFLFPQAPLTLLPHYLQDKVGSPQPLSILHYYIKSYYKYHLLSQPRQYPLPQAD